jgi:cell wall assembly regulator SMI1
MAKQLVQFTKNKGDSKIYINPDHVVYLRENIGNMTYIALAIGVDQEHGEPIFMLVDGDIDKTAAKLNAAKG